MVVFCGVGFFSYVINIGHLDVEYVTALSSLFVLIMKPKSTTFLPRGYLGGRGKFKFVSLRSTKLSKHYSTGTPALAAKI